MKPERLIAIGAVLMLPLAMSGCGYVAAGTAGGVIGSELEEEDAEIDPLEETEVGEEIYDE
jgi:F0F1-type ATP synthase membrane subunit c/vacuolar-type H+-ATPase subunit K